MSDQSEGRLEGQLEGWYTDPYGRHDARWLSQGRPTKLVRDGHTESYDAPPADEAPSVVPRPAEGASPVAGADTLRRADEAQAGEPYDGKKTYREIMDVFDQIGQQPF